MDEGSEYSIHSICRVCLNNLKNDPAYNLFLVPGLAKKLCVCTSLQVEQYDGFPKNLCTTCYTKLNDLHVFQQQCVDSVQKFKEMVASNYFVPVVGNLDSVDLLQGAPIDGEMEDDNINFDPLLNTKIEVVETEEDVFKMLDDVDKEAEEAEKAVESDNNESSESEIDFDNDNDNADKDFKADESSDSDDALPLSRLRSSTRAAKAKAKAKTNTEDDNKDDSSSFEWADDKKNEKKSEEKVRRKRRPKRKPLPIPVALTEGFVDCHICNEQFKSTKLYEEHMMLHNDQLPFQCSVEACKKGFTTSSGLRLHMDHAHTEFSEVHRCTAEGCDKTFPRSVQLTFHLRKVHNIIKAPSRHHPCTECDKVFRCSTALKKHMYKHTGAEKPICCNICNKRFHINSDLRDHLLRHAGVKNYVCPYCGVGKTTRQEWNKHILTHTKEKQFQCRQCDHASHNKQALANHVKVVHMKIKDFACQYCGKTFGKSYSCKVHERLHTGENCSECKICGKVFLFEKGLTKHLKTHEKRDKARSASATAVKPQEDEGAQNSQSNIEGPVDVKPVPVPVNKPRTNRVERVDISQLAGTSVNPISSVSVPSWSPQVNFTKKEGQHICPGCGRGFNHIGNMKLHYKIIHEKVKDFACRFCPKRFSKAQILRHHEWIHTGEKPFECKVCHKHFRQESIMKNHLKRVHENAKPPREPKRPKAPVVKPRGPHVVLNKKHVLKNFDEYQDPAAEQAAASAALLAQQQEENEAKRRAEEETRKIQEAACEQLKMLQKEQLIDKISINSFQVKRFESGVTVDDLKLDPSLRE